MREDLINALRIMAESLARELSNAPAFVKRTWQAAAALGGERYELTAGDLPGLTFYIERSRTYGRYSLSFTLPEVLWKYEPQNKERPEITIAADREPEKAARYVMSALITPALSYLEETEQRREATERQQRERSASAARLIEAARGLIALRGEQNHTNSWRVTVPVVDTVLDGNELKIEGQVDRERADLNFSKLTIEEAATMLRVLSVLREARAAQTEEEDAGEDGDSGAWLAAIAA